MDARAHWITMFTAAALSLTPAPSRAHCDSLDGPVVKTARRALQTKDVRPVLAWVKRPDEAEVRRAFFKALMARKAPPAAREVAERGFLETVVRVHRTGEGASFTGLKPSGAPVPAAVRQADLAVENADASSLERQLGDAVRHGVRERFARLSAREVPGKDVAAGRAWVEAYVDLVHWVEHLDAAARGGVHAAEVEDAGRAAPAQAAQGGESTPAAYPAD